MANPIFKHKDLNSLLETQIILTVKEVSLILRCHRSEIYELVKGEYLEAHYKNGYGKPPLKIFARSVKKYLDSFSTAQINEKKVSELDGSRRK